jgi:hypothetical protein
VKNVSSIVIISLISIFLTGLSPAEVAKDADQVIARQVRINKELLLSGTTEQGRLDAAMVLLDGESQSRAVLLYVLAAENDLPAKRAICKALSACRPRRKLLKDRKDFLEPLIGMLINLQGKDAQLAAEAILIYDYREVSGRLSKLVRSAGLENQIRLNVIYALKGWATDKEAISELVRLRYDKDSEIAAAASDALPYWVRAPADGDLNRILRKLKSTSTSDIIKERLELLEEQIRILQAESTNWQQSYFVLLDEKYDAADGTVRGQILLEKLSSDTPAVKLWSLKKMAQDNLALWPDTLGVKLLEMVSDNDRAVRLLTAEILSRRSDLNPADPLLTQFKAEQDSGVRLAIFEALGEACKFAGSPGIKIDLSAEVKNQTLEIAAEYVQAGNAAEAKSGSGVIQKLLELDNIKDSLAEKYIALILQRYETARAQPSPLRSDLLLVMAKLCDQGTHSAAARQRFSQLFVQALDAADDAPTREAAVTGLVNTDKVAALEMFKQKDLISDSDPSVITAIVELAAEVGKFDDITWLKPKADTNGHKDLAWAAIIKILQRQDASEILNFSANLAPDAGDGHYADALQAAENKAQTQPDKVTLLAARSKLADWYVKNAQHDKTIDYCNKLIEIAPGDPQIIARAELRLFNAHLAKDDIPCITQLLASRLAKADIAPQDSLTTAIDKFLSSKADDKARKALLDALTAIKLEADRPQWSKQLTEWQLAPQVGGTGS